jgi:hypothetical protein
MPEKCSYKSKSRHFVLLALLMMITANAAPETGSNGKLHLTVLFDNRPISAIAVIRTVEKENFVLQTNGGEMKQTPFDVTIPAGKYALYVHANIHVDETDDPFLVRMQSKAIPIEITSDQQLEKTVTIPAGILRISTDADNEATTDMQLELSGVSSFEGEIPGFQNISTSKGRMHLPVEIVVPPGTYHYQLSGADTHKDKQGDLKVIADKTLTKTIYIQDLPTGFLSLHIVKDNKTLSPAEYQYLQILVKSHNGDEIIPFTGNGIDPITLPVGVYDVILPIQAVGGKTDVIRNVQIEKARTTARDITIPQPGTLNLKARWTHQPVNISDCIHYYNPFNSAHLGALMGGHTVSRGECFNDTVVLAAQISLTGHDGDSNIQIEQMNSDTITSTSFGGNVTNSEPVSTMHLVPGSYDITVWPVGNRALQQTLNNVVISPGRILQKQLEFHWPE